MAKRIMNMGLMSCLIITILSLIGGCSMYNKNNKNEVDEMKKEFVTMKTTLGDMKFELYPDIAPKTVENFITHAKNGYYNGVIFHRVIKDFMIQGGDPTGTGRGGESIWGRPFADEFSDDLHNFYGALSMANSGPNTNGSQFFIVQHKELPSQYIDSLNLKKEVAQQYKELGGTPHLDGVHTVFGKMIDGFDVLDNIASQDVDFSDSPLEDIVIKTIEVSDK